MLQTFSPWKGRTTIVTTDYHSNFFEVDRLTDTTSETVIRHLKNHLARHGIPNKVVTDNAAQYTSAAFKKFSKEWGFEHSTISPGNSQANGAAEAAVKVAKRILKKAKATSQDPYLGLLNLRNAPTEGLVTSPAQRLLGRRTQSNLPMTEAKLQPSNTTLANEAKRKEKRRAEAAEQHPKKDLKPLKIGDNVRMQPIEAGKKEWHEATVTKQHNPRSFEVVTEDGSHFKRNRRFLRKTTPSSHSNPPKPPRPTRGRPRLMSPCRKQQAPPVQASP